MMSDGWNKNLYWEGINVKIPYECRDYEVVAEKQQLNTARTKIPSAVIREKTG